MMRIRQRHDVRQHQVLQAVAKLITTQGMDKVTIKDIAEEIGVTEGAIYRHFASKREIFSFVVHHWEQNLLSAVLAAQLEEGSPLHRLERVFQAQLSEAQNYQALAFIIIVEAIAFEDIGLSSRVASILTDYLEGIQRILAQGIQDGSVRPDLNVDAAATTFFGLIQSTATLWALNGYNSPLAEQSSETWGIFERGVGTVR